MKQLSTFIISALMCLFAFSASAQTSPPGKCVEYNWSNGAWDYATTVTFTYDAMDRKLSEIRVDTISGDTASIFTFEYTSPSAGLQQTKQTNLIDNGSGFELSEFIFRIDGFGNNLGLESYLPDPNNGNMLTLQNGASKLEYKYAPTGLPQADCDSLLIQYTQYTYNAGTGMYDTLRRESYEYSIMNPLSRIKATLEEANGSGVLVNTKLTEYDLNENIGLVLTATESLWTNGAWVLDWRTTSTPNSATANDPFKFCNRVTTPTSYLFLQNELVEELEERYNTATMQWENIAQSTFTSSANGGYQQINKIWDAGAMTFVDDARTNITFNTQGYRTSDIVELWDANTSTWITEFGSTTNLTFDDNDNLAQLITTIYDKTSTTFVNSFRQDYDEFKTGVSIPINSLEQVHLYPNPFTNSLTLELKEGQTALNYTLTDLTGRTVNSGDITGSDVNLNLDNLRAGTYILNLSDGGNTVATKRVVKW